MDCLHCLNRPRRTSRGLCHVCNNRRAIREQYPLPDTRPSHHPPCRHCGHRRACRARGLCDRCFGDMAIRQRYPVGDPSRRGLAMAEPAELPQPVGTLTREEKLRVLIERADKQQRLWHPADVKPDLN